MKEVKKFEGIRVLLADGGDRQTLPLCKAFRKLGCEVTTLNASKLDNGYTTRYADYKILDRSIKSDKKVHAAVCKKWMSSGRFDVAVTTSDDTAEQLSLMKEELQGKCRIAVNAPALFDMAYDKNNTMKVCTENGIPCPKTFFDISRVEQLPLSEMPYPVVIKPRRSFGAIGYRKADTEEELKQICLSVGNDLRQYVIQEYIPQTDIQYECAMFIDSNNEVKTSCVFSKNRWFPVHGGSSTCNVTVDRPDIAATCAKLLQTVHWRGAADVDLIQDPRDGKAKIMEINPRVSASVKVVLTAGVNIAQQILELALEKEVTPFLAYQKDVRLRCIHTDLLWFFKSKNRFHSHPSWFSWRHTKDQIWSWSDPLPFFAFSIQSLLKYKREMKRRLP